MRWWPGKPRVPLEAARWAAIDCEASGLDPARDRLLSVGAVAVQGVRIEAGRGFSSLVAQAEPSGAPNILVHGIGADAQRAGRPARAVLEDLAAFLGDAVPVAFHAAFDAEVLRRAFRAAGQRFDAPRWLDLAALAPALFPDRARGCRALDDWLAAFGIEPEARHDALGDAFAAAQLLLVLLAEARRQRLATVEDVLAAARGRRWLAPG